MLVPKISDDEFLAELENNFNIKLNKGQNLGVILINGAILIIAIPGAGKTFTLCVRLYNMIRNYGIDPRRILAVTFSNASANDMTKKFNDMFEDSLKKLETEYKTFNYVPMKFSTIHSFAYRVLLDYGRLTNTKYVLIDTKESGVYKRKLFNDIYNDICNEALTDDIYENITRTISYVKNKLSPDSEIKNDGHKTHYKFYEIYTAYEQYKQTNGIIDYDDMLSEAHKALRTNLDIRRKYTSLYDYVLVDEAQDTSTVQFEIIRMIAHKGNICMVGDDDQTIYEWRSADVKNFLEFDKYFPNAKKIYMEQNYRSSKKIVRLCNAFIKGNKVRYDKELYTENEEGNNINIVECYQYSEQSSYILEKIKSSTKYDDFAIIYRNNNSAFTIANLLMENNIPFYIKGYSEKFFNHWVIKDIMNFFYFAMNTKDYSSFISIAYKMDRYISKIMVNAIKDYAATNENTKDVFEILLDLDGVKSFQRDKIKLLKQEFIILKNKKVSSAIKYICYDLGYLGKIEESSEKLGYNIEIIKEIIFTLGELFSSCKNIDDFDICLSDFRGNLDISKNNYGTNAVTLTTAHSSKGLEWQNVFMVDLVNGVFPAYKEITEEKDGKIELMEASRRLFYVGLSRSKLDLNLLYSSISIKNDTNNEHSKFIDELRNLKLSDIINEIKRGIPPKIKPSSSSFKKHNSQKGRQISMLEGTNNYSSSIYSKKAYDNVSSITNSSNTSDSFDEKDSYKVGDELNHRAFGKGKVVRANNTNVLEVVFDSGENKMINLEICKKKNLIL